MALLDDWKAVAYNQNQSQYALKEFWDDYFEKEKNVYKTLLRDFGKPYKGTVEALAETFGLTNLEMAGFLDGIQDSLKVGNPIDTMDEKTEVNLDFDKEKLFREMVDARAEWLYTLPEWDAIYDKDTQRDLIRDQKQSHTVHVKKIGRNDPCPCGSGKKYKYCHGRPGAEPLPGYSK
ncbi:MAG: SEC-C metal-binding domain-containing protein [Lachnospiraceae bacterium]|nr:SEC-C domain-containing protein [Lachnospiraceae bacterium]MDD7328077.1 SEC-C metal-binding domain-containing protein [Lachnospiraceae bacterium]MDY2759479.1 SEC-C metal-binding domain-containing protein [Lachnospiraceae bacterium]